jgi:hypothetical protein
MYWKEGEAKRGKRQKKKDTEGGGLREKERVCVSVCVNAAGGSARVQ